MSTTKLEEGIVGVDGTSNQAMIQRFSTQVSVHLNFQRPGFVLQARTIVCWLNMAGNSVKRKDSIPRKYVEPRDLLFDPTINIYLFTHFIIQQLKYISMVILVLYLILQYVVQQQLSYLALFSKQQPYIKARMNQHASSQAWSVI